MKQSFVLLYGLKGKEILHVDTVTNGRDCGCVCPSCAEPLIARNAGRIRRHHFAHASGIECEWAIESQLHLLAKKIYAEAEFIVIPKNWIMVFGKYEEFPSERKNVINVCKTALIFESEKSCLKMQSYFGIDNDITVACCGSSISLFQIQLLLQLYPNEIIVALDTLARIISFSVILPTPHETISILTSSLTI